MLLGLGRPTFLASVEAMRRFWAVLLGVALAASAPLGCSSSPTRPDGVRDDLPAEGPEIGPLEEQARGYVDSMCTILQAPSDDPFETVRRLGDWLEQHHDEIVENAAALRQRVDGMTAEERLYYEEVFGAWFAPSVRAWWQILDTFRQQYPEAAVRVDGLMVIFD
jgi:hypothetical protein